MSLDMQREYLLGGLTPDEREKIAEEYFSSDDAFDQMMEAERDLLDAYARGELRGTDKLRVERHLLASDSQLRKLAVAKALAGAAQPRRSVYLRYLPYAAMLLVGVGLSVQYYRGRPASAPTGVVAKKSAPPFVIELASNAVRGGDARQTIAIPGTAEIVRIRFEASELDGVLTAELLAGGGSSVFEKSGIAAQAGIASFEVPADVLHSGDFELYLRDSRRNATGYFAFRVK